VHVDAERRSADLSPDVDGQRPVGGERIAVRQVRWHAPSLLDGGDERPPAIGIARIDRGK
jgi:hypothetical protein